MKLFAICIFSLLATTSLHATELKGSPEELKRYLHPDKPMVTLHGNAERTVQSDTATVSIVVRTEDKKMQQALAANSDVRQQIIATLTAADISKDDIQTASFSTSPEIGYFSKRPTNYTSVNKLKVTITTELQFSAVASLVDQFKSVSLGDIEYKLSTKKQLRHELLNESLAALMAEKAIYEQQLGVKLKVIGINSSRTRNNQYERDEYGVDEEIIVTGSRLSESSGLSKAASKPLSFGELRYTTNRSVAFEIIEK